MAVYVKTTRHFYGRKLVGMACSKVDDMALTFRSTDQAMRWIEKQGRSPYLLEVEEHSRPSYEIINLEEVPGPLLDLIRAGARYKIIETV